MNKHIYIYIYQLKPIIRTCIFILLYAYLYVQVQITNSKIFQGYTTEVL